MAVVLDQARTAADRDTQSGAAGGEALEPRLGVQALEDLGSLGEQRLGPLRVCIHYEPLRMLKEGHGEPERNAELAEHPGGRLEARLDAVPQALRRSQARTDPQPLRLQEWRTMPGWQPLHCREQLPNLPEIREREGSLDRPDETRLDGLVVYSKFPTSREGRLAGGHGVGLPALGMQHRRPCRGVGSLLLNVRGGRSVREAGK